MVRTLASSPRNLPAFRVDRHVIGPANGDVELTERRGLPSRCGRTILEKTFHCRDKVPRELFVSNTHALVLRDFLLPS